jgi:hypothetical protein
MTREIRIYVEGGGDQKEIKASFRRAFGELLKEIRELARGKRIGWTIIACGSGGSAYDDFQLGLSSHPDAFNILLLDAEGPLQHKNPWDHLRMRSGHPLKKLQGTEDENCHLMVEIMENWFLADRQTLRDYYGREFQESAIPGRNDVENIPKQQVYDCLKRATRKTQKGEYHKTRHAPEILEKIKPELIQAKAKYCRRLFAVLQKHIRQ